MGFVRSMAAEAAVVAALPILAKIVVLANAAEDREREGTFNIIGDSIRV